MKKTISLRVDARLLCTDEASLKQVCGLIKELEDKGYLEEGKVVFEEHQENEIAEIFDRHFS